MSESNIDKIEIEISRVCNICSELFTDPRILPCLHTFCLKCIEKTGVGKKPNDSMRCPSCGGKFEIPMKGFLEIKKNDFIENLSKVLSSKTIVCDNCSEDEGASNATGPSASGHCSDCNQNLCRDCIDAHKKLKSLRNHQLRNLETQQMHVIISSKALKFEQSKFASDEDTNQLNNKNMKQENKKRLEDMNREPRELQPALSAKCQPSASIELVDNKSKFPRIWSANERISNNPIVPDIYDTMRKLNMMAYHDTKLTWTDVITLRETDLEQDRGLAIIQRLMRLDYRAPVALSSSQIPPAEHHQGNLNGTEQRRFRYSQRSRDPGQNLHPMDIMNVIYNCCDGILRQILTGKLFTCRLAIPLLLPDIRKKQSTFQLWSLRNIVAEWKSENKKANQLSLVPMKHSIVSFVRIGDLSRSKSQLINKLLSPSKHDTFFHRECKNGSMQRTDSNGTIEMSCFFPTESNKWAGRFSALNLRGDATTFKSESEFVFETSSLVILMINLSNVKRGIYSSIVDEYSMAKSRKCQIVLSIFCDGSEETDSWEGTVQKCVAYFEKSRATILDVVVDWQGDPTHRLSFDEWESDMECTIRKSLELCPTVFNMIEIASIVKQHGFLVDEDDPDCSAAFVRANSLLKPVIEGTTSSDRIRYQLLPLQEEPWKEWCKLQKELHRAKHLDEQIIAGNKTKQNRLRLRQTQLFQSVKPNFTEIFFNTLFQLKEKNFFLRWIKLILDDCSRNTLPTLHIEYHSMCAEIRKQERSNSADRKALLCNFESQMSGASFGLEHILREMGQIYEAFTQSCNFNKSNKHTKQLPSLAAELLLMGIPFELMDGDIGTVPAAWVSAVISEIEKLIGNKILFVISVIGVQSSGKSTLLNTMLGLEFAVSAGRCTRGVFCQLVPVDKNNTELPCDYVMIIDTEGLRNPELQERSWVHDNELATFVIGIGDLTLVNIKGEVSSEIQDVLEIVIHAMLRIQLVNKKTKLKPSCMFIHQNVSDVNADNKMMFGKEKFHSFLDRVTKAAAVQESNFNYTRFNQVIAFDDEAHVLYMPDLWEGEPPMATVNGAYSQKVDRLKTLIMNEARKHSKLTTISTFGRRILDLWKAILNEDFVFSFRNSEEVIAFSNLDKLISQISWDFKNESLKRQTQAVNEILSCSNNLQSLGQQHKIECVKVLNTMQVSSQKRLEDYFIQSEYKHMLEQWRSRTLQNLKNICEDEIKLIERKINKYVDLREMQLKCEIAAKSHRDKVLNLASTAANELKKQSRALSEEELNNYFDENWNNWLSQLSLSSIDHSDIKSLILNLIHSQLAQLFGTNAELLKIGLSEHPLEESNFTVHFKINEKDLIFEEDSEGYSVVRVIRYVKGKIFGLSMNKTHCLNLARQIISTETQEISTAISNLNGQDFQDNHIIQITQRISILFSQVDSNRKESGFSFKRQCQINFAVHIFKCAINNFIDMSEKFKKNNDPIELIQRDKPMLLKLFRDTYREIAKDKSAAEMFSRVLQNWIERAIIRDLGRLITDVVLTYDPTFRTKETFINRILTELCQNHNFEEYMEYIEPGELYFRRKIDQYKNEFMNSRSDGIDQTKFRELICKEVRSYIPIITTCLNQNKGSNYINQKEFFNGLRNLLKKHIECPADDIRMIVKENVMKDAVTFTNIVRDSIQMSESGIVKAIILSYESSATSCSSRTDTDELLASRVIGCSERCPFCNAPCCLTEKDHSCDHWARQHYPNGVTGIHEVISLQLDTLNCQTAVASEIDFIYDNSQPDLQEPFRNYRKYFPRWKIDPDRSMETSTYWKWFMATYHDDLVKHYEVTAADIPDLWREITTEQALESLSKC